jgi:hypothetical protein
VAPAIKVPDPVKNERRDNKLRDMSFPPFFDGLVDRHAAAPGFFPWPNERNFFQLKEISIDMASANVRTPTWISLRGSQ